ncbi:MAG: adenine-specific methyltransferase EcoRI family protein [Spirochaetota bacterium]|jgi:hypothetical protein|nr:adenine-specific methyltransferase EcoRI family protein [Spirochaetota bacterium]
MANMSLSNARRQKVDEFYTQLSDIEKELGHYTKHFKGKVVFCNCDDPETSNFWYYFIVNFERLGLKKLITTHFELDKPSYMLEYEGGIDARGDKQAVVQKAIIKSRKKPLKQNFEQGEQGVLFTNEPTRSMSGDFRSPECIELLQRSDIVVTNPPFSLFREYVAQLIEHKKKFIIIGDVNALSYKETFLLIKENKIWPGVDNGGTKWFQVPPHYEIQTESRKKVENGIRYFSKGSIMWFTNLDHAKRHEKLVLYKKYNPGEYPKYDNCDVIEVSTYKDIPVDYDGVMGVPITFADKYNPEQFEILGIANSARWIGYKCCTIIGGKKIYNRLLIKKL